MLQEALELAKTQEPVERRLRQARKEGLLSSGYLGDQIGEAEKSEIISKAEAIALRDYHDKVQALLAVDDFAPEELARSAKTSSAVTPKTSTKAAGTRKKATTKKKVAKKTASTKKD